MKKKLIIAAILASTFFALFLYVDKNIEGIYSSKSSSFMGKEHKRYLAFIDNNVYGIDINPNEDEIIVYQTGTYKQKNKISTIKFIDYEVSGVTANSFYLKWPYYEEIIDGKTYSPENLAKVHNPFLEKKLYNAIQAYKKK